MAWLIDDWAVTVVLCWWNLLEVCPLWNLPEIIFGLGTRGNCMGGVSPEGSATQLPEGDARDTAAAAGHPA